MDEELLDEATCLADVAHLFREAEVLDGHQCRRPPKALKKVGIFGINRSTELAWQPHQF